MQQIAKEKVSRVNMAITTAGESIIVGAELTKRTITEEGKTLDIPYLVASLYYDDLRNLSINSATPTVCCDILRYVFEGDELVVFRSGAGTFRKGRALAAYIQPIALNRGLSVRCSYKPQFYRKLPHLAQLANDALARRRSVVCAI